MTRQRQTAPSDSPETPDARDTAASRHDRRDRRRPADGRGAARGAGRRRRKGRGRKRLALGISAAVTVLAIAAAGAVYLKLNGNIDTFDGKGLSPQRPKATVGAAQNILLIGSDTRAGANAALGGGKDAVGRSDTTILLHVYADHRHAVGVSIPRDTLVDIPPCLLPDGKWTPVSQHTMFNAAFSVGGTEAGNPACTQNTVEALTGLRIDHTVVVSFQGFATMTEAVGGVPICLPQDIYQKDLNPNRATRGKLIYHQGKQEVSGKTALDYVRLRHGIGDSSDIGRTKRQQAFIGSLIKQVKAEGFSPTTLLPLANAATKSLTVDPGLGTAAKLLDFAMSLKDIDLADIQFLTAPWRYDGPRVALVHPEADELWATLKADHTLDGKATGKDGAAGAAPRPSTTPVTGAGVSVAVYNGTTTNGLASRAAEFLRAHRFTVTGTATARSQTHATTEIQYGAGLEAQARNLAKLFPGAVLEPIGGSSLNLVAGRDYAATPTDPATPAAPDPLPSSVTDQARSADKDLCADLSYG
ncbi:LCP family protein [Streptomyces sp. NPDC051569]|uniref:LCP family protein n=1 Tax=Streptomyces sp. NPDC051569 TaxID=3365661 RepID=UPI003798D524